MPSWYKYSLDLETFYERNILNDRIRHFLTFADTLEHASKLVYQTARGARKVVEHIRDNKRISSYDDIKSFLKNATDIALDSPSRFGELCNAAAHKMRVEARKLEHERKHMFDTKKNTTKGLKY